MGYANPVSGRIADKGATPAPGGFYVTATFADHLATGRAPGVDIGNGGSGAAVISMGPGVISLIVPGKAGSTASIDASIVRVRHSPGDVTGYAHLAIRPGLAVGQVVPVGYLLGVVASIGATAAHLHFGLNRNGVEIDPWPELTQNEEDMLQGANPYPIVNRKTTVIADGTRFRSSPFVQPDNVLTEYAAGTVRSPDWQVDGTMVGTSTKWYGCWGDVKGQLLFGYLHESVLTPLTAAEPTGGHSDAELADAAKKAARLAASDVSAVAATAASKYQ